jgi:hypothetical protein
MTRSGAKNDFSRKSGAGKSGRVAQIRHVSSGIGGRRRGILRLPGELARGVGVWNALRMRSYILVHGFPSTLVRGLCTLSKKKTFRGNDVKTPHIALIPVLGHTHMGYGLVPANYACPLAIT